MRPISSWNGGPPGMLMPLTFVLVVSMIKDIIEDVGRHKSDNLENNRTVFQLNIHTNVFEKVKWTNI